MKFESILPKNALFSLLCLALLFGAACATMPTADNDPANLEPPAIVEMREGDTITLAFPGSPALDLNQAIRRDGKIAHPVFGEIGAAGRTPAELEKEILRDFGKQMVTKEVRVVVTASQFPVYVNGAVQRPGEIASDRPLTALEAIMKAGGFDYNKANLKNVRVIRNQGSEVKNFEIDFRGVLQGKQSKPFYLKPSDIIYVPEKFTLF